MKTLNVVCKDDAQVKRLSRFKDEDSDALDRILNTGYNEGRNDGEIYGFVAAGVSLIVAGVTCKIVNYFRRK